MTAFFDIFQSEATGDVLWLGSATTLDEAKVRAQQFAQTTPGEYLVLNQKTGHKLIIDLNHIHDSVAAD